MAAIREFLGTLSIDGHRSLSGGLFLADASALAHCGEPDVAARILPLLVLGDLATCAAVSYELASLADKAANSPLSALRRVDLHWLPTDDVDLRRAAEIQNELTQRGQPLLPWSRLVIAALTGRYAATVLHYTSDYDLIAKVTGQETDWVAPPGTLPAQSAGSRRPS